MTNYRDSYIRATEEEEEEEGEEASKIMATAQSKAGDKNRSDQIEKLTECLAADRQKNADANGTVVTAIARGYGSE